MAFQFSKYKWLKVTLTVLLSLFVLIIIAVWIADSYLSPILSAKAKAAVLKSTDSLYHADFDKADINIFSGKIVLHHVTLTPDTAVYHREQKLNTAPENLFTVKVNEVLLNHIHLLRLYFSHELDLGELVVNQPEVQMDYYPNPQKANKAKDNRTIYQRLKKTFKLVHAGQIRFTDSKFKYTNYTSSVPAILELKKLDFTADDLLIDSATQYDNKRFLYCSELNAALHDYSGRSADALYAYQVKLVQFSTRTRQLSVHSFSMQSLGSPEAFFQKTHKDRFTIRAELMRFNDFDFAIYDKTNTLKASGLLISKGYLGIYSNPRPHPQNLHADKSGTFPNKAISTIPVRLDIDTMQLQKSEVRYEEYNTKNKRKGYIAFNQINSSFYNITNDSAALKANHWCKANIHALFLNRAKLHLEFNFNLTDSLYTYNYHGTLGPMDLQAINVATVPLASASVKLGFIKSFDFDIQANRNIARGKVVLLYNNLKVQLLKKDDEDSKMHKLFLKSLLANALVIKSNNPDDTGEQPRVAHVVYQRPPHDPFFKTLWRTLLTGIKTSAGLSAKP